MWQIRRMCLLLALAGVIAACGTAGAPASADNRWPTQTWRVSSPEAEGMDPARLRQLDAAIDQRRLAIHSLLIVRNGAIVAERYAPPYDAATRHTLYSVTKSVTSALVGAAIADGRLPGVDAPIATLLPPGALAGDDPRRQAITLEHLLTMTAGLAWVEGDPAYGRMVRSPDWVESVLALPMAEAPGARFNYCSGCSHVLSAILDRAVEPGLLGYAEETLFAPLGIRDVRWETDPAGRPVGGWGLELTPRDMAKLGYLYLNQGQWDGRQIIPAAWVAASVTAHVATDEAFGYGYQWWTAPRDGAYFARGRGGQLIIVAPERALVVVVTAALPDDAPLWELFEQYIAPAAPPLTTERATGATGAPQRAAARW